MSLVDRTNETIPLSLHQPLTWQLEEEWPEGGHAAAQLYVDADQDSSFDPPSWVHIGFTDSDHDADSIKLTYEEAELLYDRLGRILGHSSETNR